MNLEARVWQQIEGLLTKTVRDKLASYSPETEFRPFHDRLLGKDRFAMFSFIHSMNTTFGMCIWEQVAVILARSAGFGAERQFRLYGDIDAGTQQLVDTMLYDLRAGTGITAKAAQTESIRSSVRKGSPKKHPDSVVDLFIKKGASEYYFDITSAKPNMKDFQALKRKLLTWDALRLSADCNAAVFTAIAIPYNPYHPAPYERWTLKGLYDLEHNEVMVGNDFWNFVAGEDIHDSLLGVFAAVGDTLRPEIDNRFTQFR